MQRVVAGIFAATLSFAHISCMEKASPEDCKKMCENLVKLRGKIEVLGEKELIARAEEKFNREEERLRKWMERDLKGWDEELEQELGKARSVEEKAALKEDYAKKKEVTKSKHLPGIEELKPKKEAAVREAKQKAMDSRAEWDAEVDKCVTEALKDGTIKEVADCRIEAVSTDQYWNVCR